jgi:hypothetical protein
MKVSTPTSNQTRVRDFYEWMEDEIGERDFVSYWAWK